MKTWRSLREKKQTRTTGSMGGPCPHLKQTGSLAKLSCLMHGLAVLLHNACAIPTEQTNVFNVHNKNQTSVFSENNTIRRNKLETRF